MLPMLSQRLASFFVHFQAIRQEEEEVYAYSVEILLATVLNFAALYIIALFTGKVWETTMFVVGFVPLRALAGGYHAKTHYRCLMILLSNYAFFLGLTFLVVEAQYAYVSVTCLVASVICLWFLSPVEDKNKPLSVYEKKCFRHKSRIATLIYTCVVLVGILIFQHRIEFMCVSVGMMSVSLSLVAALFRSRVNKCPNGEAV